MSLAAPAPTDLARAQAILARPATVRLAGSRLATARRWTAAVLQGLVVSAVFSTVGAMGMMALDAAGVVPEVVARIMPSHATPSAPEKLQWVALPTSPLVEAGRLENGGISLDKMLQAWRDAGMSPYQARDALESLSHLRPVLLGRDDPVLAAQLRTEAAQATSHLEQSLPLVMERLRSGKTVVVDDFDRQEWDRRMTDFKQDIMLVPPRPEYPLAELVARAQANPGALPPMSPLLEAGFDTAGQWSAQRMLEAWEQAGMHPMDASFAIEELRRTVVDLEGLPPHVASEEIDLAQRAMEGIVVGHWPTVSRLSGLSAAQLGAQLDLYALPTRSPGPAMSEQGARQVWDEALTQAQAGEAPLLVPAGLTMAQARKALAQAVSETGLRALSLGWGQWESPAEVYRTAVYLSRANAELQRATGLPGKVLGLDGRVELAFGRPMDEPGAYALVSMDRTGRLQMVSDWQAMAHEWWHAFDQTASRAIMAYSTSRPLSENTQPLRVVKHDTPFDSMRDLNRAMRDNAPRWREAREAAAQANPYWERPTEVLAFGFAAVLNEQGQIQVLADPTYREDMNLEPARGPRGNEAHALWPSYQAMFRAAAPLYLTQAPPMELSLMANARAVRGSLRSSIGIDPGQPANDTARSPTVR